MKLSEIITSIGQNEIIDDRDENTDVIIMVQDTTDTHNVKVCGYLNGDTARLESMIASRMVRNEEFRNLIVGAVQRYFHRRKVMNDIDCTK